MNAYIRRDFWEDLVTRDDDLQFWAVEADVFWSVAVANEGPPLSSIDIEVLTILNSTVPSRQRRNARTKLTEPLAIACQPSLIKACSMIKANRVLRDVLGSIARHDLTHIKVAATHPKRTIKLIDQPSCVTRVVSVQMRGNDAVDRIATNHMTDQLFPAGLHTLVVYPCIN